MTKYQLLPRLSDAEYASLKADIEAQGVLIAVELDEDGNILDGHHRVEICKELGKDYETKTRPGMSEAEKRAHVRRINLNRRHLNSEQKRNLVTEQLKETPEISNRQIADMMGVNDKTVWNLRRRLEATAEIPRLKETVGKDGKKRTTRPKRSTVITQTIETVSFTPTSEDELVSNLEDGLNVATKESDEIVAVEWDGGLNCDGELVIRNGNYLSELFDVPDNSIALILTEPTYDRGHINPWRDLGEFAERVLQPGGVCAVFCNPGHIIPVLEGLEQNLDYIWMAAAPNCGPTSDNAELMIRTCWKPLMLFSKQSFRPQEWVDDMLEGMAPGNCSLEVWEQKALRAKGIIEAFSQPEDIVLDPCVSDGSVAVAAIRSGRSFTGCCESSHVMEETIAKIGRRGTGDAIEEEPTESEEDEKLSDSESETDNDAPEYRVINWETSSSPFGDLELSQEKLEEHLNPYTPIDFSPETSPTARKEKSLDSLLALLGKVCTPLTEEKITELGVAEGMKPFHVKKALEAAVQVGAIYTEGRGKKSNPRLYIVSNAMP